jgi:RNA polymerase sigma-70 factor (ECF subfamily)
VDDASAELLVRLLTRHQEEIFRHIFALMPHEEDARDVLQETSVALYRKFTEYDPTKPFLPWAYRFAELEVFKQRERNSRVKRHFTRELLELMAREREQMDNELHARLVALEKCLDELPPGDRALIRQRYHHQTRVEELVRLSGASRRTLFRNLDRVRRVLLDCIQRRTAAEPT